MNSVLARGPVSRGRTGPRRESRSRPSPTPEQVRVLLSVALRPSLLTVLAIATCMLVALVAANSDLTGASGAVAAGWFAVHQVPLTIGGASLGVLPLLPTLVLIAAVARGCARVVHSSTPRHECWWVIGAAVTGPVVISAIALAVAADASSVIALSSPNPLVVVGWVVAVHLVGSGIGVGVRLWRPLVTFLGVPDGVLAAARPALRAAMALLATGGALVVVSLLAAWSTVGVLLEAGGGVTGGFGLVVLSVLYLPNMVIGATAVLVGSTAHVGSASVSLFEVVGGPVPALPVLGALPEQAGGDGWLVAFVIPAAIGVMFGRDCARSAVSPLRAAETAVAGAAAVSMVFALLGVASGGDLGTFGSAGVTVATFAAATAGWLAVCGAVAAALVRWRMRPDPMVSADRRRPRSGSDATGTATLALSVAGVDADDSAVVDPEVVAPDAAEPDAPGSAVVVEAELLAGPDEVAPLAEIESVAVVDAEIVDDRDPESDLPESSPTSSD